MDVVVSHFVFCIDRYSKCLNCSQVQLRHLLHVVYRGSNLLKVVLIREIGYRKNRNGDDDRVELNCADEFYNYAGSDGSRKIRNRGPEERLSPGLDQIGPVPERADYADHSRVQNVMNDREYFGREN